MLCWAIKVFEKMIFSEGCLTGGYAATAPALDETISSTMLFGACW